MVHQLKEFGARLNWSGQMFLVAVNDLSQRRKPIGEQLQLRLYFGQHRHTAKQPLWRFGHHA